MAFTTVNYQDYEILPGADGSLEIGIIDVKGNGRTQVLRRDLKTKAWVSALWFGTVNYQGFHLVNDLNNNGHPELVVIDLKGNGNVQALVRDTRTMGWLPSIWFSPVSFDSSYIVEDVNNNGAPELVIADGHSGNKVQLLRRDLKSRQWLPALWFNVNELMGIQVVDDQTGNNGQEVLVIDKKADNRIQVLMRDFKSQAWQRRLWFNTVNFQALHVGGDKDNDNKVEIVVIDKKVSGQLQVFRRELVTTQWHGSLWHNSADLRSTKIRASNAEEGSALIFVNQTAIDKVKLRVLSLGAEVFDREYDFTVDYFEDVVIKDDSTDVFLMDKKPTGKLQAIHRSASDGAWKGSHWFH